MERELNKNCSPRGLNSGAHSIKVFKLFGVTIFRKGDEFLDLGVPWAEEEHKAFLVGLGRLGKGNWKGISSNFVKTRNPTQVASHAQKYYKRKNAPADKKGRPSIFDMGINDKASTSEAAPASSTLGDGLFAE